MDKRETLVWTLPTRVFHWTLAGAFAIAWLTEDDFISLHEAAGYTILGLIAWRLVWGLVGPRHARFSDFVHGPRAVFGYLRDILGGHPRRYLGHNPAGGAMVVVLLVALLLTGLSGMATLAVEDGRGPLAGFAWLSGGGMEWLEEIHEFSANLTLGLVGLHVAGVVLAGRQHGENLVAAMLNGFKRREED
ncbi:MAG: cytochrome b/b6 domain-containing protein [Gammaproteobacteria bacterium]